MQQEIRSYIESLQEEMTALRRDLHRHAETGWLEIYTSAKVAGLLRSMGYEVYIGRDVGEETSRMGLPEKEELDAALERALAEGADPALAREMAGGFTGVVAVLRCGEGPVTALRFDIDALPLCEEDGPNHRPAAEGFRSVHPETMHACGHDAHAALGIGTARTLMRIRDRLHGTVKLLFQPAEEGVRGAKAMVEKGWLDDADRVMAAHIGGGKVPGTVHIGSGASLATTKFDAVFRGKPAHAGASPHAGSNAMLSAATAILNLQAIPRHGSAATRINVGVIHGGTGRNVICPEVRLLAEVRGTTSEANRYMEEYAMRILRAAADMHGCTLEVIPMGGAESAQNTPAFACELVRCFRDAGLDVSHDPEEGAGGSEDFSYMAQRVQSHGGQSCYFVVQTPCAAGGHQSGFDIDERGLPAGVRAFTAAILQIHG